MQREDTRRKTDVGKRPIRLSKVSAGQLETRDDLLATEEPLEIRLAYQREGHPIEQSVSITMRTPGHDGELALGFLYGEGILKRREQVAKLEAGSDAAHCNIIRLELQPEVIFDASRLQRNFYTTSSCGVCSKASLEALEVTGCHPLQGDGLKINSSVIENLSDRLAESQSLFSQTGGLHAAGLFSPQGKLLCLHEDVGRHNAVDKVVGEQFLEDRLPLSQSLLMVSGRSSFEIMQKALMAGIPAVAAVSAPSSLAVDLARRFGMTLLGFVRGSSFNIYTGKERIVID